MERAVKEDVRHVIEQAPLCAVTCGCGQVICAVEPELGDYAARPSFFAFSMASRSSFIRWAYCCICWY